MDTPAEIEEPKIAGNYSARTAPRWVTGSGKKAPKEPKKDVDEIHRRISTLHVSPAQMYSTESGRLFHAGDILIVVVGLPARGKTNLSIGLCRYLRWLGVRANLFHFGDYRREEGKLQPRDEDRVKVRQKLRAVVSADIIRFFEQERGQVAIFDGVNGVRAERVALANQMAQRGVRTVFIESQVTDKALLAANISDATSSPDYEGWEREKAIEDYTERISKLSASYEPLVEPEMTWIRSQNFAQTILVNQLNHDFLTTKIIFYLMNLKIKSGSVYFARCSDNKVQYNREPPLDEKGRRYFQRVFQTLATKFGGTLPANLQVWTSTRLRTQQAAQLFQEAGLTVKPRPEMAQLRPGAAEGLSDAELRAQFPVDFEHHRQDPYHHRYPRAESYHDLALKLEPLILEVGRINDDVLIIADETVIRVFYGYLMASSSADIPSMRFPMNEIVQITYNAYANKAERIPIEGMRGV